MALTLGTEFALFMRSDTRLTYTEIETALDEAGLDNFTINRNFNGEGYDIHLIVRSDDPSQYLEAADTVRALAEAVEGLSDEDEVPAPPPPSEEPPTEPPTE